MLLGSPIVDALVFVAFGFVGAILLLPLAKWISYKRDCKKYGKEKRWMIL